MQKNSWGLSPLLLCVALVSLVGCKGNTGAPPAPPPTEVDVMTIAPGEAAMTQDLPGRLEAMRTAEIRARVEGVLEKRLFQEGSDVRAGQILYHIDDRTFRAAVASAKADVAAASAAVKRYEPLVESKAVSQQDMDQAVAALKKSESTLAQALLNVENANVPAPISGRIGRSLVTEGALVGKGEATQMATIQQIDKLYVNFSRSYTDMLSLQLAMKSGKAEAPKQNTVQIVLEDNSVYPMPGKLLFSNLAVDEQTGTVLVRAEVPNPQHLLLPGMFVRVRFNEAQLKDAITVPQSAVQFGPQGAYVMGVDAENKVVLLPIVTGSAVGANWIVNKGLKAGDRVVVKGLQKIRPGAPVNPVEGGSAPAPEQQGAAGKPSAPVNGKKEAPAQGAAPSPAKD